MISQKTGRNIQEKQTQKIGKLIAMLKELGGNKFFGKLLITYESGQNIPVKKMEYIRLSRSSLGEEPVNTSRPVKSRRNKR